MSFTRVARDKPTCRALAALAYCIVVTAAFPSCRHTEAPEIGGTWSGLMMLEVSPRTPVFVDVEVVFHQHRGRLDGRWHTKGTTALAAAGDVVGKIYDVPGRHQVDLQFTFDANPADAKAVRCEGVGGAAGQLTRAATIGDRLPSAEDARWIIRLKAFEGIDFRGCGAIPYATWTLARNKTR
jgi:hypothetical protein